MSWSSYKAAYFHSGLAKQGDVLVKKERKKPNIKTLLTDEQVLDVRRQYEFEGVSPETLYLQTKEFGVSRDYLYRLLQYQTRSKLIPVAKPNTRP